MERTFASLCDFHITTTLKQHWTQDKFSYLARPRPDHGLMLLLSGSIDFVTPETVLHAHAGDVVFLPKGCRYEAVFLLPLGPIDNYLINFDSATPPVSTAAPALLRQNAAPECAQLFRQIVRDHRAQSLSALQQQGLLLLLLDAVFRAPAAPHTAVLDQARTLLQDTDLSVQEIARHCSLSESSLRALFQAHLHISPMQLRLKSRLDRAAYLLESTDLPISEIADETHFYDAAAFCRLFKKQFGQTPRAYARSKKL